MTPEQQASKLAHWLDQGPGVEPPEGLDADVVEAVYALHPDRCPAPRVDLDDILAGVTTGPFAPEAPPELAPRVPEGAGAEVLSLAAARRRRVFGGLGALAAAAMALFVALPVADQAPGPGGADRARVEATEAPQASPSPAVAPAVPADFAEGPPLPSAATASPDAPQKARQQQPRQQQANEGSARRYEALDLADGMPMSAEPAPPPEPAKPSTASPLQAVADGAYSPAQSAVLDEAAGAASAPVQAKATTRAVSAEASSARRDRETGVGGLLSKRAESSNVAVAPEEAPADDRAYADAYEEEEEEDADALALPTDLASLRAAAWPGDYNEGWWRGSSAEARLAGPLAEAEAADAADASRIYEALIDDPSPVVGQDMAFRAASQAAQAGDPGRAAALIARGKARSSANTPYLARLHALEGQLLEARGDVEGARRAYTTAAGLNRAR